MDQGVHTVTVRAAGRLAETATLSIGEGEEKQIEVHPGAVDPAAVATAKQATKTRPRTLGWVLGGVGIAGIATAGVTGAMLVREKSIVETNCPNKACLNQKGLDAVTSGKTLVVVNSVAWIAGAAGLGLGAYLILSSPRSRSSAALAPAVAPDGAALSCVGTF